MKNAIIVINGKGGVGKDTLANFALEDYAGKNISSIDLVKEIALDAGWDGVKDAKGRKLLSDLKKAFTEYGDLIENDLSFKTDDFLLSRSKTIVTGILFVHIREPKEIQRYIDHVKMLISKSIYGPVEDTCVLSLLITRDGISETSYGNVSDDNVDNFKYDLVYANNSSLDEAKYDFIKFLENAFKNIDESTEE